MPDLLSREENALYDEWKRSGRHWEEYGAELIGTLFLVFCVVGIVAFMFGHGSPFLRIIPSPIVRLFVIGLALGGASWLVAVTPPGRLSGAHINPAVSLGFWALGKMHGRDLGGYVAGQMLGAWAGAVLGRAAFGSLARSVQNAVLNPGPHVGQTASLLAEIGTTFVLTFVVFTCVSHKALIRWTPAVATLMVALLIALDGSYSGCGMNPARWFGPAMSMSYWHFAGVYVLGPLLGAVGAAFLRRTGILFFPMPHTGKLFHDARYRSVFIHDRAPSNPPVFVRRSSPPPKPDV